MTLKIRVLYSILIFLLIQGSIDQTSAACPIEARMANFSADNFLGTWYGFKRYETAVNALATSCTAMNSTLTDKYVLNLELCNLIHQQAPFKILGVFSSIGTIIYQFQIGEGKIINRISSSLDSNSFVLKVNYQFEYIVVDTDYTNYAG